MYKWMWQTGGGLKHYVNTKSGIALCGIDGIHWQVKGVLRMKECGLCQEDRTLK